MKEIACASGVELLMDYLEGVLSADLRVGPRRTRGRLSAVRRIHRVLP